MKVHSYITTVFILSVLFFGVGESAYAAVPTQVLNAQATGSGYTSAVRVTWSALGGQGVTGYRVIANSISNATTSEYVATTTNQYTFSKYFFGPYGPVDFAVYAINASGTGPASATTTVDLSGDNQIIDIGSSCTNLLNLATVYGDPFATYNMTADINCTGVSFVPISFPYSQEHQYVGEFNGQGYSIRNLTINVAGSAGLFSNMSGFMHGIHFSGGSVTGTGSAGLITSYSNNGVYQDITSNISVSGGSYVGGLVGSSTQTHFDGVSVAANVTGSGSYVGGIAGNIMSGQYNITNTRVIGNVSGQGSYIGGLAGAFQDGSTPYSYITTSYMTGTVSGGHDYVGGLVGYIDAGQITNSYATSDVVGHTGLDGHDTQSMGGLAGYASRSLIDASYFTGSLSGGYSYLGGLVGWLDQSLVDPGSINTVQDSFSTATVTPRNAPFNGQAIGGLVGHDVPTNTYVGDYFYINSMSIPGSTCTSQYNGSSWIDMGPGSECAGFTNKTDFYNPNNSLYTNGTTWGSTSNGVGYWTFSGVNYPQLEHFLPVQFNQYYFATSTTDTTAHFDWITSHSTMTQIVFGPTSTYASTSALADVYPLATLHSTSLYGLVPCSTYHYALVAQDFNTIIATSTDATVTTTGCTGNAVIATSTDGAVSHSASQTTNVRLVEANSTGVVLGVPSGALASDASFQIKKVDTTSITGVAGYPAGYTTITPYTYIMTALSDVQTKITSFTTPLSLTVQYTPADITGLDEANLKIFRYDGSGWVALTGCSTNTSAHTVTCYTDHFSTFALFGAPPVATQSNSTTGRTGTGGSAVVYGCKDPLATNYTYFATNNPAFCVYASKNTSKSAAKISTTTPTPASLHFATNLYLGMTHPDVKKLQQYLNTHNYIITKDGSGSRGHETTYFGDKTRAAVLRYQRDRARIIATPNGIFGPATRAAMNAAI